MASNTRRKSRSATAATPNPRTDDEHHDLKRQRSRDALPETQRKSRRSTLGESAPNIRWDQEPVISISTTSDIHPKRLQFSHAAVQTAGLTPTRTPRRAAVTPVAATERTPGILKSAKAAKKPSQEGKRPAPSSAKSQKRVSIHVSPKAREDEDSVSDSDQSNEDRENDETGNLEVSLSDGVDGQHDSRDESTADSDEELYVTRPSTAASLRHVPARSAKEESSLYINETHRPQSHSAPSDRRLGGSAVNGDFHGSSLDGDSSTRVLSDLRSQWESDDLQRLRTDLKRLKIRFDDLNSKMQTMQEQHQLKNAELIHGAETRFAEYQAAVQDEKQANDSLISHLQGKMIQMTELYEKEASLRRRLQKHIHESGGDLSSLLTVSEQELVAQATTSSEATHDQHASASAHVPDADIAASTERAEHLQQALEALQTENTHLKELINEQQIEIAVLKQSADAKNEETKAIKNLQALAAVEAESLKTQLEQKDREVAAIRDEKDAVERQKQAKIDEIISTLNRERTEVQERYGQELNQLRQQVSDLTREASMNAIENASWKSKAEFSSKELEEARLRITNLQSALYAETEKQKKLGSELKSISNLTKMAEIYEELSGVVIQSIRQEQVEVQIENEDAQRECEVGPDGKLVDSQVITDFEIVNTVSCLLRGAKGALQFSLQIPLESAPMDKSPITYVPESFKSAKGEVYRSGQLDQKFMRELEFGRDHLSTFFMTVAKVVHAIDDA
ncbi:uncharacterized protein BJ171DRAFT_565662 [Polychytrium aggregatum]|uniref:uncharacterized protein n=1 Tax=Polychytrium aggregatum TaxID=110093 RepID=UPI0022FEEE01|nr:uncharacterized protein BJ171DRAFT_565662 [Polychytrium aggregatum]KAI9207920.1 hypothetical protein BJ171DRAFT_565662 [Polychytrium aggregatum]